MPYLLSFCLRNLADLRVELLEPAWRLLVRREAERADLRNTLAALVRPGMRRSTLPEPPVRRVLPVILTREAAGSERLAAEDLDRLLRL